MGRAAGQAQSADRRARNRSQLAADPDRQPSGAVLFQPVVEPDPDPHAVDHQIAPQRLPSMPSDMAANQLEPALLFLQPRIPQPSRNAIELVYHPAREPASAVEETNVVGPLADVDAR